MNLRKEIFWGEEMGDDRPVEAVFQCALHLLGRFLGRRNQIPPDRAIGLFCLGHPHQRLCRRFTPAMAPAARRNPCTASSRQACRSESNRCPAKNQLPHLEQAALEAGFGQLEDFQLRPEPQRHGQPIAHAVFVRAGRRSSAGEDQSWMLYVAASIIFQLPVALVRLLKFHLAAGDQLVDGGTATVYQRWYFCSKQPLTRWAASLHSASTAASRSEKLIASLAQPHESFSEVGTVLVQVSRHERSLISYHKDTKAQGDLNTLCVFVS